MSDDRSEAILKVLRDQEAAVAAGDAEGAVAANAPDVVSYDMPPPLASQGSGPAAIEGIKAWFETWEDGVQVELSEPTVLVEGDLAVVFGLSRMRGVKKGAGPLDAWNRRTVVLRNLGGAWRIVHEHASYPTQMDGSGLSAIDLKP